MRNKRLDLIQEREMGTDPYEAPLSKGSDLTLA